MDVLLILLIVVLVLLIPTTILITVVATSIFSSAPWVATKKPIARKMCEVANIKKGDRVLDLGCGDASILIVAAKEFGAECVGVDLNPAVVLMARVRARLAGVSDKVQITRGNMYTVELPDTDVVVMYLLPKGTRRVERRLKDRYKHLRVVSHGFKLDSPEATSSKTGSATVRLYQW